MPFQANSFHGAGADHFLKLLDLLRNKEFGDISDSLANFRARPGSIKVQAISSGQKASLTQVDTKLFNYHSLLDFAQLTNLTAPI